MNASNGPARRLRFGAFELDLHDRDLRKNGLRVKLQEQPFQVLELLLETPGEVVTRSRLAQHLWPGLHVNFERSLNTAVNALRQALGDSPRNPRFIETRPGLGYRFIAPVELVDKSDVRHELDEPVDSIAVLPVDYIGEESRHRHIATTYTGSFEAYQNYLKGRYFHNKMSEDGLHQSIAYFEAALAIDSSYALAFAGLADTYCLFAFMSIIPSREAYLRAKEYATAALQIDQDLAEAHAALAGMKKLYEWDWAGSEVEYQRALELNPNCASGHHGYAAHLAATGKHDQALVEIRRAQELDPLSLVVNMELAWQLYLARDFQASMEQSWKTLVMEPKFSAAQNTLGLAYEQMGMHEEAIVEFLNARACSGDHPVSIATLAHAYASAGDRDEATVALRELEQMAQRRYVSPYCLGLVHSGLGQDALAFEWLNQAYTERDVWLVWLKVEPRFDHLQTDARFQDLLRRIGLSQSNSIISDNSLAATFSPT